MKKFKGHFLGPSVQPVEPVQPVPLNEFNKKQKSFFKFSSQNLPYPQFFNTKQKERYKLRTELFSILH